MLDNSSNPASMRYLISQICHDDVPHWGYSRDVKASDIGLIRSHSVRGLIGENLFEHRVLRARDGEVMFDLPPNPIFDQKLLLALPFFDRTREFFSDAIRDTLAFSSVVAETGFDDVDGEFVSFDAFLDRPRKQRRYFAKYAGVDTNVNWGGMSVFRLDGNDARMHIERMVTETRAGRPWIIQPEYAEKEQVLILKRDSEEPKEERLTSKYSCFYGPAGLLGIRSMHRGHFKVHGQSATAIGLPIVS
jgi:hypothetical protein